MFNKKNNRLSKAVTIRLFGSLFGLRFNLGFELLR